MIDQNKITEIDNLIDSIKYTDQKPVRDGIVNLNQYESAKYKILWVLKEPNDESSAGGWDMRDFIASGLKVGKDNSFQWKKTWKMIVYVTWGILNEVKQYELKPDSWLEEQKQILQKMAFINIKKIPGKGSIKDSVLKKAFARNRDIIFRQIEAYKPDIVILVRPNIFLKQKIGIG